MRGTLASSDPGVRLYFRASPTGARPSKLFVLFTGRSLTPLYTIFRLVFHRRSRLVSADTRRLFKPLKMPPVKTPGGEKVGPVAFGAQPKLGLPPTAPRRSLGKPRRTPRRKGEMSRSFVSDEERILRREGERRLARPEGELKVEPFPRGRLAIGVRPGTRKKEPLTAVEGGRRRRSSDKGDAG